MQKEIYYYVRDDKNRPITTVCLLVDAFGDAARGVAFCSKRDNPSKRIGRKIAKQRAITALTYKDDFCSLRVTGHIHFLCNSIALLSQKTGCAFIKYKSAYLPELSVLEKKLICWDG